MLQRQVRLDRRHHPVSAVAIAFVDHENIGDLHDPRLERLHIVARAWHQDDNGNVGGAHDVDFVLADTHGFDDHQALAGSIEDQRRVAGRARKAAHVAARRHAADEHVLVRGVRLHAHAIAENRPASKRTGRIDGDDADGFAGLAGFGGEPIDERALARAGWAGDTNQVGAPGVRENVAYQAGGGLRFVFDQRDGAGHRSHVAGPNALGKCQGHLCRRYLSVLNGGRQAASNCRAITRRCTSLVPSPIVSSFTSRKYFSAG